MKKLIILLMLVILIPVVYSSDEVEIETNIDIWIEDGNLTLEIEDANWTFEYEINLSNDKHWDKDFNFTKEIDNDWKDQLDICQENLDKEENTSQKTYDNYIKCYESNLKCSTDLNSSLEYKDKFETCDEDYEICSVSLSEKEKESSDCLEDFELEKKDKTFWKNWTFLAAVLGIVITLVLKYGWDKKMKGLPEDKPLGPPLVYARDGPVNPSSSYIPRRPTSQPQSFQEPPTQQEIPQLPHYQKNTNAFGMPLPQSSGNLPDLPRFGENEK